MLLHTTYHHATASFYEANPRATLDPSAGTLRGDGSEVAVRLGDRRLSEHTTALSTATGLWLTGDVRPEDVAALASLPALRHLDLFPGKSPIPAELLRALSGLELASLRLRIVDPATLAALAGLQVRALRVNASEGVDASDAAAWDALASLGLEELSWKSSQPLPTEAARAMASGGSLRRFVGEVVLDAPTLEELLRAPLELLALNHFASELREVVVSGHAHLRWLELLGTHVALRAEDCPALVQTSVTHARQVELRRLPSLRLAHLTGNVVLDDLPVLECIGAWGEIDSLTLVGTPALRRVVLRAGYGAAVAHVARAAGAHVVTDPGKVAKVTPSAPKRTVSPKLRSHPRLGWDGVARAVLVVGKPAAVPLAEKVVSALGTVAAWWANERGEHISAVAAFDSTTAYLDAGVHDLVLGRVVACVTDGAAAAITRTDLEHEREAVADELADLWVDANGIVKKCAFDGEVGVYLVACGPDSRAALSAEGRELEWSDERGVPYVRVDLDRLPEVVSLTGASSGLHPRHACR